MRAKSVLFSLVCLIFLPVVMVSGNASAQVVQNRIAAAFESGKPVLLQGTVPPLVRAEDDAGPVAGSLKLSGMSMDFVRTADQQARLETLLRAQQDSSSPSYHRWLTTEQFADQFGMTQADMARVSSWLESQGFTIDKVADSRNAIRFSGTALQAEQAFHTHIHQYVAGGEMHFANATEVALPAALAGVVGRIGGLNDFRLSPRLVRSAGQRDDVHADFTSGLSGGHFVAPGDFALIYDLDPLYSSGFTGAGQTIGIVGQTDIVMADITSFRAAAGLPANNPTIFLVPGSADPGVQDATGDINEADLDLEWSGGVAQNASIVYVNSTNVSNSLDYAIKNKINGLTLPILSTSYGNCEPAYAQSDITTLEADFQQANVQGQTIVGPAGDTGAADCDFTPSSASSAVTSATHGLQVDYPASSAYVTGMGGSEFTGDGTAANPSTGADQYWGSNGSTDLLTSALSYIPEQAWNDTTFEIAHGGGLSAAGGGASTLFAKPSWQAGVPGIPSDGHRDVPDVSLNAAAAHDPYLYCTQIILASDSTKSHYVSSCNNGFRTSDPGATDDNTLSSVGGTSAAAPGFAGILAVLEQKLGVSGGLGNVNPSLYSAATNATTYAMAFHDVAAGDNKVPCTSGSTGCPSGGQIGFTAGVGYDQASGLGSVDAANLAAALAGVAAQTGSTTTIGVSPSSPVVGTTVTLTATVTANSGSGTPTGSVTFTIDGVAGTAVTLTGGVATTTTSFTTGGAHTVSAAYSGDTTYLTSAGSVTIVVAGNATGAATTTAVTLNPTTIALDGALTLTATVQSATAGAINGTVTFTIGSTTVGTASLVFASAPSGAAATATLSLPSATPALGFSVGSDTVTAAYGGDVDFAPSSGTATIAVTSPGLTVAVTNMTIASSTAGSTGSSTITITSTGGYAGTVNLTATAATLKANYLISPLSVTLASGASGTSTITLQTVAANAQPGVPGKSTGGMRPLLAAGVGLGAFFLLGISGFRRKRWPVWAGALLLFAGAGSLMGCGGSKSPSGPSTSPPGTYTVTVTATDATTSTITASTSFTVTIQ